MTKFHYKIKMVVCIFLFAIIAFRLIIPQLKDQYQIKEESFEIVSHYKKFHLFTSRYYLVVHNLNENNIRKPISFRVSIAMYFEIKDGQQITLPINKFSNGTYSPAYNSAYLDYFASYKITEQRSVPHESNKS